MPTILPIDTPSLGDRSYLVHDGRVAVSDGDVIAVGDTMTGS